MHLLILSFFLIANNPLNQIYEALKFAPLEKVEGVSGEEVQKNLERLGLKSDRDLDGTLPWREKSEGVSLQDYEAYFEREIRDRNDIALHYFRLALLPKNKLFQEGIAVTYYGSRAQNWIKAPPSPNLHEMWVRKEDLVSFLDNLRQTLLENKIAVTRATVRFDQEKNRFAVVILSPSFTPPPSETTYFREVFTTHQEALRNFNHRFLRQYREKPLFAFADEMLKNKDLTDREIYQELSLRLNQLKYGKYLGAYYAEQAEKAQKEELRKIKGDHVCTGLHSLPPEERISTLTSIYEALPAGGTFILIEPDAATEELIKLCTVTKTLSLLANGLKLETNLDFHPLSYWIDLVKSVGFTYDDAYDRKEDPTRTTYLRFKKPSKIIDLKSPYFKEITIFIKTFAFP